LRGVKKRILLVEDDSAMARVLIDNLVFEGFEVAWAADGESAFDKVRAARPDLVLLDIMLPGTDGFELMSRLGSRRRTPIIMLTARVQKSDRLRGLNLGADDYITKPFDLEELLARVNAVLRRASRPTVDRLTLGEVSIDFRSRVVRSLTREIELLRYLADRQEQVVGRDELLREVWGYPETPLTRSVDHAIARLRKKIEPDLHRPRFIHTVHGDGYCLTPRGRPGFSGSHGNSGSH
jgi:DNA-binding response OmpR family regulator